MRQVQPSHLETEINLKTGIIVLECARFIQKINKFYIMSGIDRQQTIHVDCPKCHSRGYIETNGIQEMCASCEGAGILSKDIPYKFETRGNLTKEEIAQEFDLPLDEVKDSGHDDGE